MSTKAVLEPEPVVVHFEVTRVNGQQMLDWLSMLAHEKRTGQLTVNYSQGTACSLEWKERCAPQKVIDKRQG